MANIKQRTSLKEMREKREKAQVGNSSVVIRTTKDYDNVVSMLKNADYVQGMSRFDIAFKPKAKDVVAGHQKHSFVTVTVKKPRLGTRGGKKQDGSISVALCPLFEKVVVKFDNTVGAEFIQLEYSQKSKTFVEIPKDKDGKPDKDAHNYNVEYFNVVMNEGYDDEQDGLSWDTLDELIEDIKNGVLDEYACGLIKQTWFKVVEYNGVIKLMSKEERAKYLGEKTSKEENAKVSKTEDEEE